MVIPPFTYYSPLELKEVLEILASNTENVLPLAGGTDILVMMKEERINPGGLISLKNISELKNIKTVGNEIVIGSNTTVGEIERSNLFSDNPIFGDLIQQMATRQIRNRATIGGNLCTAAACADFPPVLLVNDAKVVLLNRLGTRQMSLAEFITGPRQTALEKDELLFSIICKKKNPGSAYIKFGVRESANISIVGIACSMEIEDGKISEISVASTAASPIPLIIDSIRDVTIGKKPQKETWEAAADKVAIALDPISDIRGSMNYRIHLAKVGTVRALDKAYHRLMKHREMEVVK